MMKLRQFKMLTQTSWKVKKTTDENETTPTMSQPMPPPMAPTKKCRKSNGNTKGKQPVKRQKLTFDEEEVSDETATEESSTSLGECYIFVIIVFFIFLVIHIDAFNDYFLGL